MVEINKAGKTCPQSHAAGHIEYFPSNTRGPFLEISAETFHMFMLISGAIISDVHTYNLPQLIFE